MDDFLCENAFFYSVNSMQHCNNRLKKLVDSAKCQENLID
jgi:hypothetical protein